MIEAMVAPPEISRNALRAQSEGRVGGGRPSTPVQRDQQFKHYKGRCPCVRMYGAPATSAGTPRRLRAQEPRPGSKYKAGAPASPAWGLRRTAVGRAPRATSTPPRAALPPRFASCNATVGRASRARLSPPRHPTPLLSGTCLTSAGRPPLRRILATEGPGHPEGYPGPAAYLASSAQRRQGTASKASYSSPSS